MIPPVEITFLVTPVCRSITLTLLKVLIPLVGSQLVLKIGPSAAQTSVFLPFSMTITPFGPEKSSLAGGIEQLPAKLDLSSWVTTFNRVSTMMMAGFDPGPFAPGAVAEAASA